MDVDRLRSMRRYVFTVPRYHASAIAIVVISLALGLMLQGQGPSAYLSTLLIFGLPALASSVVSTAIIRPWSGAMLLRRSMFLSLISMIIIAVFLFFPYVFSTDQSYLLLNALIFGQSLAFALSYFAILSITNINRITCVLPAATQPLFQIGVLLALERFAPDLYFLPETFNLLVALAVFATITVGVFAYVKVIEAPIRQAFGFSIFDLISSFFDHLTSDSLSMERFFQTIGQSVTVPAGHLLFRDAETGKPRGMVIVPYVHPGPLGNLGASNVTRMLDQRLSRDTGCLLVLHGTSTHDLNPTSAQETEKLAGAARTVLSEEVEGEGTSSRFVRVSSGSAKVCGQMIGGRLFAVNTFSPGPTEDVELGLGLAAMEAGRQAGSKEVVLADAHNCFTEEARSIHAGNPLGYDLIRGVSELSKRLSGSKTYPMKVGFGTRDRDDESVGPLGIRVCVVEIGSQRVAYVVIDGNNLAAGMREKLMEGLSSLVDESEIMTSDNHSVNLVLEGYNPVGPSVEGLLEDVLGAARDAMNGLAPCTARIDLRMIRNISVFGPGKISEIVTTINSMISMGKGFTAVLVIAVIALCVLIITVLRGWAF
jgi:putative membrane protein